MNLKIIEISGPDSSIAYPIFKDGGRERVIEWLCKELGKTQTLSVVAQSGSRIENTFTLEVLHSDGLQPNEFFTSFKEKYDEIECDILHIHNPQYLVFSDHIKSKKIVLTHHGLFKDMSYFRNSYNFTETYVSHYLRNLMDINCTGFTIHNPIPTSDYPLLKDSKQYDLLFLGDCNKKVKRLDIAIEVAQRLNIKLLIAGKADNKVIDYLNTLPYIQYLGEIDQITKINFISKSRAVICPNDAPEAFCLVAAEANVMGTPVLSSNNGGLPEVVEHNVSGFICNSIDDYVSYYKKVDTLQPIKIRNTIYEKFDILYISQQYQNLFYKLLRQK